MAASSVPTKTVSMFGLGLDMGPRVDRLSNSAIRDLIEDLTIGGSEDARDVIHSKRSINAVVSKLGASDFTLPKSPSIRARSEELLAMELTMHRVLSAFKNHSSNHVSEISGDSGTPQSSSSLSTPSEHGEEEGLEEFQLDQSPLEIPDPIDGIHIDDVELADLVVQYGHAPSTAWLEKSRYRIWRPSDPVPQSSFSPVQGYLHAKSWVFAWGSPLVSDEAALQPTLIKFITWVQSHDLRLVYCCVPEQTADLLADMGWSTISCISEDIIHPQHILELTQDDDKGGHGSPVKDLKKNLRRAERANVEVKYISQQDWSDDLRRKIENGIIAWKRVRTGLQLAATSFDPWLDFEDRQYWVAVQHGRVVGVLILTPARGSYVIKNAVQFPDAPKGTSERLIHSVLRDLQEHHADGAADCNPDDLKVTFNISAARDLKPTRNISGWKFAWLSQTYAKVARGAHLLNRHDFRSKFAASAEPMFVCYPTEDGLGLDGIEKLLKLLRR